jgi:hypothetical protein
LADPGGSTTTAPLGAAGRGVFFGSIGRFITNTIVFLRNAPKKKAVHRGRPESHENVG